MREARTQLGAAVVAYALVFGWFALPWLRESARAIPSGGYGPDSRLIVWILWWVARALASDPRHVFDAPINYPAPAQLAGSEHFVSSQLLFTPCFWATGNAVLAANAVALLSYPLAALALDRLLVALGCAGSIAWVGGLLYALGPLRVPANLGIVQTLNLYLPLVALALHRLCERPQGGPAALLALVFALGLLSSYYLALMLSLVTAGWAAFEAWRRPGGRLRLTSSVLAACAPGLLLLAGVSLPYLARPEAFGGPPARPLPGPELLGVVAVVHAGQGGTIGLVLPALGILALLARSPTARRIARLGLAFTLVGLVLMLGPEGHVYGRRIVLPFALLQAWPLGFFRSAPRFVVVAGFGAALLAAAGLEALRHRLGPRAGTAVAVAAGAAVVFAQRTALVGPQALDVIEPAAGQARIYDTVGEVAGRLGPGPLLELPVSAGGRLFEPDAMVGATRHGLPLVTGSTGHPPPHRALLDAVIARLPSPEALADLVDMTALRWVLLRPASDWSTGRRTGRAASSP